MKIELNNLKKRFDRDIICGMNLKDDVNTLALIGRSGCGKSTLLRILGGLVPASEGTALLDGKKVTQTPDYRASIGFVFQQSGLFSHMSARENITLPLEKVHSMSKEDANKRADELLDRFGLIKESSKLPSQLSGGQRQRIAIARALAPKPKIMLLDEPTSALDPEYTSEVLDMINELKNENLSFIIATHEMGFALHTCEKVAFISDGNIREYGESEKLFSDPQTEELKSFLSKLLQWRV